MSTRDDLYKTIVKKARFGLGPDKQPWAQWLETDALYCLGYPDDLSLFKNLMVTAYKDSYRIVPSPHHIKSVLDVLVADAHAAGLLAAVTEEEVLARGSLVVATDDIDLALGESDTVTKVLARIGDRPDLFCTDTTLVRLVRTHEGRLRLDLLPPSKSRQFADWADKTGMRFFKKTGSGRMPVRKHMPPRVAGLVLAQGEWSDVRQVAGISTVPVVRRDGTLANGLGYDRATGLVLDVDADLRLLEMPEEVTRGDVFAATATILDLLHHFTFDPDRDAEASRANAVGLLLTPHLRRTFPDMLVPLHAVDAPSRGSGKTLLAGDLPGAFGGGGRSLLTFTGDEGETRKRLTSEMGSGGTGVLCYDNVASGTTFSSPFLAAVLTSPTYADRMLGGNTQLVLPQTRTFTVTGNRLRLDPDMAARAVLIAMRPETARPDLRTFSVRLDDHREVARLRPMVVEALLTCVQGWVQAGCPGPVETPVMRQFSTWATTVSGLLEYMGVHGHLRNTEYLLAEDDAALRMGVLLGLLWEAHGTDPWTSAMAAEAVEKCSDLDPELPEWLERVVTREKLGSDLTARSKKAAASKIGHWFRRHVGAYYAGLRIEKIGFTHGHVTQWCLREEYPGAHGKSL